ncbi:hypothetical protein [Stenomitos frigidus]|uniref:Transmembrane protein n=1 Tax=Stenomitos frigidus ULC18 TaxID=2107698 RepID=A0A2T1E5K2_9CYAN|nr:hypothetical protein C7B82_14215 [Stenomitos frigidus ULC18]
MVIIAVTAVSGLLSPNASSPNASNGNQVSGAATIRETTQTATNSHARIPLWLFGAIALSCAAGSLLVSKQANRPPRPRKSIKIKPLTSYPVTTAIQPTIAIQPPSPSTSRPQPQPGVVPSFVLNPRQVQHPAKTARPSIAPPTLMQLAHQEFQSATGQATDVPVTVVPSEDKHPLDWGEASLADQLDIRKRRSISSLL